MSTTLLAVRLGDYTINLSKSENRSGKGADIAVSPTIPDPPVTAPAAPYPTFPQRAGVGAKLRITYPTRPFSARETAVR